MQLHHFLLVASLLSLEAHAYYGPEFKTSSPGFHIRRQSKLQDSTGFKLPGNARPLNYDLTLAINLNDTGYFIEGEVTITLDVDDTDGGNGTYNLLLNSAIDFGDYHTFTWNDAFPCNINLTGDEFIGLQCDQPINGTNQKLKIQYSPRYSDDMQGAYVVDYYESGVSKLLVATQFEQDYARRIMPCFDEPEYKAPIQLTLKTDTATTNLANWIANTKVLSSSQDGTVVTTVFEPTPNMSAYLLAFVATTDFKNVTNEKDTDGYNFAVFARPTAENYVSIAVDNGPKLINLMSNFTGISYASLGIDKMTLAAIPEFAAGAMENWGLITFREELLIDEGADTTTTRDKQSIIEVVAHELSHQWFGDYVTTDWWSEAWLNEGFATYFQNYLTNQISNDFQMMQQFVVKDQQQAMKVDAYPDTIPLSNNASDVTTGGDFKNEFGDISYSKGASIINLIRLTMGDEAFQKGLQTYLTNNKYGNPSAETLLDTLQTALPKDSDIDLPTIFHEWIYRAGYFYIDVTVNKKNIIAIRPHKFSSSLNKDGENKTSSWWIPFSYTTSDNPDFTTITLNWVDPAKVKKFNVSLPDASDSWMIINLQAAGFYRVNYDEILSARLTDILNNSETFSVISPINRAQLIDDGFNIARSHGGFKIEVKAYFETAFNRTEYLIYETEYYPWYTYFTEMQYLMERIQDKDTLDALKEKILGLVTPQLVIPQASNNNATHIETLRRNLLLSWACRVGHKECIQWAQEQFNNYKINSTSIDNNYRDVILCAGLANTNDTASDFKNVLSLLKNSSLPLEEKDLVKALTCLNSQAYINEALLSTINYEHPPFSRMFYDTLLSGLITDGSEKVGTALKFVLTYDYSIEQYWRSIESPEAALKKIAAKIYSQDYIDLIQNYIDSGKSTSSMIEAAKEAVEIAKENLKWLDMFGDMLKSVIVYNGGSIPKTTTEAPGESTTTTITEAPGKSTTTTANTTAPGESTTTTTTNTSTTTTTTTTPSGSGGEKTSCNIVLVTLLIYFMKTMYS